MKPPSSNPPRSEPWNPDEVTNEDFDAPRATRTRVGRFMLLDVLGRGGMGTVCAAYDPKLDRRVAIKIVHCGGDAAAQTRGVREAQALARLSHPHIVPVFEVGEDNGEIFIAMEFIEGPNLGVWCRGQRSWSEIIERYCEAGRGLAAAHAAGLVHRDFKPANAVVGDDGRTRVLDFGLASILAPSRITLEGSGHGAPSMPLGLLSLGLAEDGEHMPPFEQGVLTQPGRVMGTPAYMSPEQRRGEALSPSTDQYSFCVALWEALFDQRPTGPEPATPTRSGIPRTVHASLLRGLRDDPDKRWPSMRHLLRELEASHGIPRRRRLARRWVQSIAGVAVAGGTLVVANDVYVKSQLDDCAQEAEVQREQALPPQAIAELHEAFSDSRFSFGAQAAEATTALLDDYAAQWQTVSRTSCEARVADTQTDDQHTRVTWCLDQRMAAFDVTVTMLRSGPESLIPQAQDVAALLPPLGPCDDLDILERLPPPPADRQRGAEVLQLVHRARLLEATGEAENALALAQSATRLAEDAPLPFLELAARATVGELEKKLSRSEDADRTLEQTFFKALEQHDYETAARAATTQVFVHGRQLGDLESAERWLALARFALEELGSKPNDPKYRRLALFVAAAQSTAGNYDSAREQFTIAHDMAVEEFGPHHPRVLATLRSMAVIERGAGNFELSIELGQRALDGAIAYYGTGQHPSVASAHQSLAYALARIGDDKLSISHGLKSLAAFEASFGPDNLATAAGKIALGSLYISAGRQHDAVLPLREAIATFEKNGATDRPAYASALGNLSSVLLHEGEYAEAVLASRQARDTFAQTVGRKHAKSLMTTRALVLSLLAAQDPQTALAELNINRPLFIEHLTGDPTMQATYDALEGQALLDLERFEDARSKLAPATETLAARVGENDVRYKRARRAMGRLEQATGHPDLAESHFHAALDSATATPVQRAIAHRDLALLLGPRRGRRAEALTHAEAALEQLAGRPQDDDDATDALRTWVDAQP